MSEKIRQHTLELWYHPRGGHLVFAFTHKDWYSSEFCESAVAHYRVPSKWGSVHVVFFGGVNPDASIAVTLCEAILEGKMKSVRFDDVCNGKCDIFGNPIVGSTKTSQRP